MSVKLLKETFWATSFLTIIVILISLIPLKSEFVKPIKQEFDDFDIYDLFYKGKSDENPGIKDPNIIIVQAANTRKEIYTQINKIKQLEAKVIGIDLSFGGRKLPAIDDSLLINSITNDERIINGYSLNIENNNESLIKEKLLPAEFLLENGGYFNFSNTDSNSVIRSFAPFYEKDNNRFMAFTSRIAEKYSPEKFETLKKRKNSSEYINYYGNLNYYLNYSVSEFNSLYLTNQLTHFKDKIVLLGFFSKEDGTPKIMDDIKFSPLNKKLNGKSFPDIYGVVIQANIISMILSGDDYIKSPSLLLSYLIAFLMSFILVFYILYYYKKYTHPIHIRFLFIQFISIIVIIYFFIKLFDWFNLRINILPIILAMVLCVEMFELYKKLAIFFNKKCKYNTIFSNHK